MQVSVGLCERGGKRSQAEGVGEGVYQSSEQTQLSIRNHLHDLYAAILAYPERRGGGVGRRLWLSSFQVTSQKMS